MNKKIKPSRKAAKQSLFKQAIWYIEALLFSTWLKFGPGFHLRQL